jgi:hypothetical protein
MSLVKVSGNASGTGTLTIAAPNTNSDYTLTLPTNTGTLISTAEGKRSQHCVASSHCFNHYIYKHHINISY